MNIAAFASYVILTSITPGPNNIMAMAHASKWGFRKTLPFILGMWFGFLFVMAACAAFSYLLYGIIPSIKPFMLSFGTAYLLWLAWSVCRESSHGSRHDVSQKNTVFSGMVLQFVNVKIILYGITVWSSFILPYYQSLAALAGFVLLLSVAGPAASLLWALLGSMFERLFQKHRKTVSLLMALLLIYCAVSMALDIWR